MFHASALSNAGYGFISMRKGGRRVSTPQKRKKQSILDFSPIPAHGNSSSQKGKHFGQRNQRSSTSMCSLLPREVLSTSSKGITWLIFFSGLQRISSGLLTHLHVSNYTKVHYDTASDIMVMWVNSAPNTYVRVTAVQHGHVGPSKGSSRRALCSPSSRSSSYSQGI
jgi:hypothetical protein